MKTFRSLLLGLATCAVLGVMGGCGGGGSNDGPFFLFIEDGTAIMKRPLSGGVAVPIVTSINTISIVRLSPDQTQMLYVDNGVLFASNINGTGVVQFTGYKLGDWSADGTKVFAVSTTNKVRTLNPDATGASGDLFDGNFGSGIFDIDVNPVGNLVGLAYAPAGWIRVARIDVTGANLNFITADGINSTEPRWDPTGTKLAFTRTGDIFTINVNGSGETAIASTVDVESNPVYRADGTLIYSRTLGSIALWTMDGSGGSKASFYDNPGADDASADVVD